MQLSSKKEIPALIILVIIYLVGFTGLNMDSFSNLFSKLTPVNLILTTSLVAFFHESWDRKFLLYVAIAGLTGYWIEVLGVHTGVVFGNYYYGDTLGPKILDVPLMISVNWILLIYCCGMISARISSSPVIFALSGSFLMVLLDFFLEDFAIRHGMWSWELTGVPPLLNFIGWFVISFLLLIVFYNLVPRKQNRAAIGTYFIMLAFFVANYLVSIGS